VETRARTPEAVKLPFDEMLPYAVAKQLRSWGHDVVAFTEHTELRGCSDSEIFNAAGQEEPAVVTDHLNDFLALSTYFLESGSRHPELVLTNSRVLPNSDSRTISRLVTTLARLLEQPPEGDSRDCAARLISPSHAQSISLHVQPHQQHALVNEVVDRHRDLRDCACRWRHNRR
jgi:predicted nuclease of predicted toxin-antitoxin system